MVFSQIGMINKKNRGECSMTTDLLTLKCKPKYLFKYKKIIKYISKGLCNIT